MASHERYLRSLGGARAKLQFVDAPGLHLPRRMMNDVDFTSPKNSTLTPPQNCAHCAPKPSD